MCFCTFACILFCFNYFCVCVFFIDFIFSRFFVRLSFQTIEVLSFSLNGFFLDVAWKYWTYFPLNRQAYGDSNSETVACMSWIAETHQKRGDFEDAEAILGQVLYCAVLFLWYKVKIIFRKECVFFISSKYLFVH